MFVFVIPAVFVVLGIFLIWLGVRSRKLANASKAWPSTPGRIATSLVREYESTDNDQVNTRVTYTAEVEYDYLVEGEVLRGNRVQFGLGGSSNSKAIREIVNRYPVGAEVDVYYDPAKPSQCTLEQKAAGSVAFFLIIGTLFLILGPAVGAMMAFIQ